MRSYIKCNNQSFVFFFKVLTIAPTKYNVFCVWLVEWVARAPETLEEVEDEVEAMYQQKVVIPYNY